MRFARLFRSVASLDFDNAFKSIIAIEAPLITWLQGIQKQGRLNSLVHKSPLSDITLVAWFAFIVTLPILGFNYFWTVTSVIAVSLALRQVTNQPKPKDINGNLTTVYCLFTRSLSFIYAL